MSVATFSWFLHRSLKVTLTAPHAKYYSWTPAVSGVLILRYNIRFEKHRRACCPHTPLGKC